ncbi:DUF5990 family protein [Streptacidiphilus fuscans]|uniref:Monooxygenase n=1 Tax=Streptacidiphilus fuscans TaxID=2789292 RepID=A0A931BC03_9ACTN|nr:DUF5990 family protein [Streptacidiphilus fuscans]MBF9068963.1 monooxygenase [Streptacidiphilus fuscans]MBF9073417.1 monooxygenase [Streptacidiphilus fuscans]
MSDSSGPRTSLQLRIEGHTLPGRSCGVGPDFPGAHDIHVAVQRRDRPAELLDLQPGDAPSASWTLPCKVTPSGEISGPYIQNRLGGRFVYLSWVDRMPDPQPPKLFRRAKIMLSGVPADVLADALRRGALVGRLPLTDPKGNPLCARVVPPLIEWSAADPSE